MRARLSLLLPLTSLTLLVACADAPESGPPDLGAQENAADAGPSAPLDPSDPVASDAALPAPEDPPPPAIPMDGATDLPRPPMDAALDTSVPALDAGPSTLLPTDPPDASDAGQGDAQIDPLGCVGSDCRCRECLSESCSDNVMVGDLARHCATLPGLASDGTATGRPLADLCLELVSCARTHDCGHPQLESCMCGDVDRTACLRDFASADGPCLAPTLAAAQTSDVRRFASTFRNPTFALGAAMLLIDCEIRNCAAACGRGE